MSRSWRFHVLFALAAAGLLLGWRCAARARTWSTSAAGQAAALGPAGEERADARSAAAEELRPAPTEREAVEPAPVPPLAHDALREALRRLARTSLEDSEAVERALEPLLAPPANLWAILEHLKNGGLADGSFLSLEEVGALRALSLAVLVSLAEPGAELPVPFDGRALALAILAGLPEVLEPARGILVELLAGLRDARGMPVLGEAFAAELERLRVLHPALAALYDRLLAALLEDPGREADALQSLYAIDASSPTLVSAALARWFGKDPRGALAWASERMEDPATSQEVRQAITAAVAQTAPVADAARFLGRYAAQDMLAEFLSLGGREGGEEALRNEYWNLRILGDADEHARRMLVSGLQSAGTEELMAIASEDPSAAVRSQAWITLTFSASLRPDRSILERLREGLHEPRLAVDAGEILVAAGNFAQQVFRHGSDPALIADTKDLILDIYRDRGQPEWVRRRALEKLKGLSSDDEYERLSSEW